MRLGAEKCQKILHSTAKSVGILYKGGKSYARFDLYEQMFMFDHKVDTVPFTG
jgi:hypothetical protein